MAGRLLVKHSGLDDLLVHVQFVFGSSQDLLLHTADSTKTENAYLILLTNAMGSVLGLKVLGRRDRINIEIQMLKEMVFS